MEVLGIRDFETRRSSSAAPPICFVEHVEMQFNKRARVERDRSRIRLRRVNFVSAAVAVVHHPNPAVPISANFAHNDQVSRPKQVFLDRQTLSPFRH